ncbi:uncharacterized protein LOC114334870 [Diabrotica virgifera virgifera]|uniref:Uncharacterized protein LOC114334870 n=1 Tax=Diabrotica virgifera virgifera TaxID=50390 RepID=A0A6P7G8B1_DIAVI|nr:uncharacterized protein LOC114334870 [Diabrotica virgifera virgifera]
MTSQTYFKTDRCKVWKHFGKNEEQVNAEVNIIKQWFQTQKHFPETPNDVMIQYYLTICHFSIERTKQCLDMYYSIRTLFPEYFKLINPSSHHMTATYKTVTICPLPSLTENLERIFFVKFHDQNSEMFNMNKIIAAACVLPHEVRLFEDLSVKVKVVVDLIDIKLGYMPKLTPKDFRNMGFLLEELWNRQLKEIHCFNMPKYAEKLIYLSRAFLNKELREKIFVHNSLEDLYKVIPKEILPKNYGGEEKELEELNNEWLNKLKEYGDRFEKLEYLRIDNSLRIPYGLNCDILGYYGNYMKTDGN